MTRVIDETGHIYGRLTVLYRVSSKNGDAYWHCKCECGNEKDINGYSLRKGVTKSCGCLQKEIASQINIKNIANQKFGHLTALEPTEKRQFGYVVWKCQCDCGNIHFVTTNNLLMGQVTSCGCAAHKSRGEEKIINLLKENNIDFIREKTFEDCYQNNKNNKFHFDFFIPQQNYLIEYDGKQHFKEEDCFGSLDNADSLEVIQQRDRFKDNYCKEHNIPLIRIPYTHYKNLCIKDLLLETSQFII